MKKIISALLTSFILLSAFPNAGYAQTIVAGINNDEFTGTTDEISSKEKINAGEVNVKAVIKFKQTFDVCYRPLIPGRLLFSQVQLKTSGNTKEALQAIQDA